MIIATFREGTPAAGQSVTYDGGVFSAAGVGLTPQQLWECDQAGQLEWAYEGLSEWAFNGAQPVAPWPGAPWQTPVPAKRSAWVIPVVIAAGAVVGLFVLGILAAIAIPMFMTQNDKAKESAVKEGIHSIQVGVQTWAIEHGDRYPDPSQVNQQGVGIYVDHWPTNPYTNAPMQAGSGKGDFGYEVAPDGTQFRLTGYGRDGTVVMVVP